MLWLCDGYFYFSFVLKLCSNTTGTQVSYSLFAVSGRYHMGDIGGERAESSEQRAADRGLEAVLAQLGVFGLYQRYVVLLLCLPSVFSAMYTFNYVFVADRVPHRCLVQECEGWSPAFNNSAVAPLLPADPCERYPPRAGATGDPCLRSYYDNHTVRCEHFVYENGNTVVPEFNLGCREWMRTLVGTVHQAALPLSLILTGYTSDTYGRRLAFCVFSACMGVMGLIKSLSVNYYMYVCMEFVECALGYGFNNCAYVMLLEVAHPRVRGAVACASGVAYGAGGCVLALLAHLVPRWRRLLRAAYSPALLLPLYWLAADESMRWLHAKGRRDQLDKTIRKAARWNRVAINEDLMKSLSVGGARVRSSSSSWRRLLRARPLRRRLATCGWIWIATAFVYYGLTINSVALAGDKHVNFALNMMMEMVGSLVIMMTLERVGRKWTVFGSTLLCGLACVLPFFIKHAGAGLALYLVGKLAVTMAFNGTYVLTGELFPTAARATALSALSLLGRAGSALAPQTPLLSLSAQAALYAAVTLTSACSVLLLPETVGTALPQSEPDDGADADGGADGGADSGAYSGTDSARRAAAAPPPPPDTSKHV